MMDFTGLATLTHHQVGTLFDCHKLYTAHLFTSVFALCEGLEKRGVFVVSSMLIAVDGWRLLFAMGGRLLLGGSGRMLV